MSDEERAEVIRNKRADIYPYDKNRYNKIVKNNYFLSSVLKNTTEAKKVFRKIAEEFNVYGFYSNDDIRLEFKFGSGRVKESVHKQNGNYEDFAKNVVLF